MKECRFQPVALLGLLFRPDKLFLYSFPFSDVRNESFKRNQQSVLIVSASALPDPLPVSGGGDYPVFNCIKVAGLEGVMYLPPDHFPVIGVYY